MAQFTMSVNLDGFKEPQLSADTNERRVRNGLRRLFGYMQDWRVLGDETVSGTLTDPLGKQVGEWRIEP